MNSQHSHNNGSRIVPALIVSGISWVALEKLGPVTFVPAINWFALIAVCMLGLGIITVAANILAVVISILDTAKAKTPAGHKGDAGWLRSLRHIRGDLITKSWGPYWGTFVGGLSIIGSRGREIIADYHCAATFGVSGSGKGVGVLLPTAVAIHACKIILDFKGVNTACLMKPLTERGEAFHALDLGGILSPEFGPSACYNPVDIVTDDFMGEGGGNLSDITADCEELATQLYPEPEAAQGDSDFWHGGALDFIAIAVQQTILVHGPRANLGLVLQLLTRREHFLHEMLWASGQLKGKATHKDSEPVLLPPMPIEDSPWVTLHEPEDVQNFISYYRAKAGEIADLLANKDSNQAGSFLRGAVTALRPFNITTRAHKVMSHSSFRFRHMREGEDIVNVSIIIDASRKKTQTTIASLIQWAAMTELKRCGNKNKKIYFLCDETNNFLINDLIGFLSWVREYGAAIHLFIQSIAAFRKTYGTDAVNALLSEASIKQFLSGQKDPEMLELIENYLSNTSYVATSSTAQKDGTGIDSTSYHEDGKPLMDRDAIRRTKYTILFIGKNRAAKTLLPPYASIAPFRDQMGTNPFFGKPWLLPIKLRLHHRDSGLIKRLYRRLSKSTTRKGDENATET